MPVFKMTPTVLKNFFSPRATRPYPFVVRPPFDVARGEIVNTLETCTFCGVCALKCPSQCIKVDKKTGIWEYDPYACVYCGVCVESCPSGSVQQKREYRPPVHTKTPVVLKGEPRKEKIKE